MARKLYEGDIDSGELDPDFYEGLVRDLTKALDYGYPIDISKVPHNSPDLLARTNLANNLYAFSGAKTFGELLEMRDLLTAEDGSLRSFNDFKADALKLHEQYNVNWLRSEYDNAVNSSISAANWQRQTADKELYPYLIYQTVGDSNVREEHQRLEGIKLPIEDSFWNTHYPPNDWGCRCEAVNDMEETGLTESEEARERAAGSIRKKMFKNNPGKTGVIFKGSHPYFKSLSGSAQELKAVENYGLRSPEKIYKNASKMAKVKAAFKSKEAFEKWWNDKAKLAEKVKGGFDITNKNLFTKLTANQTIKKKLSSSNGWELSKELFNVVQAPDEVYTIREENGILKSIYIKYYDTNPIVISAEVNRRKKITEIKDFLVVEPEAVDTYRKGVLMFKR